MRASSILTASALLLLAAPARAETTLPFDGEVADDGSEFAFVTFEVPEGTVEIQIDHDDLSDKNILDWGLLDPAGKFRGWGGGNGEPAVVGVEAASRSYLRGPLPAGIWKVVIGKAQIVEKPAQYQIVVHLRDAATLPPQPERAPYSHAAPLVKDRRWYAGDFHVHSRESGDAKPTLDEIADFARGRGLDFVELSDHNTTSHLDFIGDAQVRHPDLLFLPGVEFTTYHGHANGIGATEWVDHKIGLPGVTIEGAAQAFADQGAIFSINHPALDLGDACIGCAWSWDLDPSLIGAVEIATGGYSQGGRFFDGPAMKLWNDLVQGGRHAPAIGGSDDHRAGKDLGSFGSPIGDPTTMVLADELSVPAILDALRASRTVVKLQGPDDPMIDLTSDVAREGDTVAANVVTFKATITGGAGTTAYFVTNGKRDEGVDVTSDPFVAELTVHPTEGAEDNVRVELYSGNDPRTITSHVWVKWAEAAPSGMNDPIDDAGCGCHAAPQVGNGAWAVALLALVARYRRKRI